MNLKSCLPVLQPPNLPCHSPAQTAQGRRTRRPCLPQPAMENKQHQALVSVCCRCASLGRRALQVPERLQSTHLMPSSTQLSQRQPQPASRPDGPASPSGHPHKLGWRQRRRCPAEPAPLGLPQLAAPAPAILGEQHVQHRSGLALRVPSAQAAASTCSCGSAKQA